MGAFTYSLHDDDDEGDAHEWSVSCANNIHHIVYE